MALQPTKQSNRLASIDALRGVALFGVMAINVVFEFRVSIFEQFLPIGEMSPTDQGIRDFLLRAVELKAFALFSFLFGMGLAIQFDRLDPARRTVLLLRRLTALLVIGLFHLIFIWNGDILTEYAVVGFLALPFLYGSPALLSLGIVWAFGYYLISPVSMQLPAAAWLQDHISAATSIYAAGGYGQILALRIDELRGILPLHVQILPRTLGLFLLGAFVWRTRLVSRIFESTGLLVGIAVASFVLTFALGTNPFATVTLALSYGAIVLALMTTRAGSKMLIWAAPVGRMAFTNYLLQSVIFSFVFYGYGLGLFGQVGVAAALCFGTAVYVAEVFLSRLWLNKYNFGPVEWLWRRLMYGVPQEILITRSKPFSVR